MLKLDQPITESKYLIPIRVGKDTYYEWTEIGYKFLPLCLLLVKFGLYKYIAMTFFI